jgi:hypothetical protein
MSARYRRLFPRRWQFGAAQVAPSAHSPAAGQELSGTIAQRLNLEHEIHDTASKLCILGFEPLKWSLIH